MVRGRCPFTPLVWFSLVWFISCVPVAGSILTGTNSVMVRTNIRSLPKPIRSGIRAAAFFALPVLFWINWSEIDLFEVTLSIIAGVAFAVIVINQDRKKAQTYSASNPAITSYTMLTVSSIGIWAQRNLDNKGVGLLALV